MRLTNSAFADQGLTGSILGGRIGQMDCGGSKYIDIAAIWVRSHLTDVTQLSQRGVVGWGMWDGTGETFLFVWENLEYDENLVIWKPWIRWEHGQLSDLCHICPFALDTIFERTNVFFCHSDVWNFWNFTNKYYTKDICETLLNCLKFKLFYIERERIYE